MVLVCFNEIKRNFVLMLVCIMALRGCVMRAITTVPKQHRPTFNFTPHIGLSKALLLSPANIEKMVHKVCNIFS